MAETDGPWEAPRPRALLGQNAAKSAVHGETARGSAQIIARIVPGPSAGLPAEEADCWPGEPGTSAHPGAVGLARCVHCTRSQGHSHFGLGLVQRRIFGRVVRGEASGMRGAGEGSLRSISRALAGAAAGAGLLAYRADFPAPRTGRGTV